MKATVARVVLTLFAGVLFYSSWSLRAPALRAPAALRTLPTEQRLELARRMGDALSDPKKLKPADVQAARAAWGEDSARMLSTLRQASR